MRAILIHGIHTSGPGSLGNLAAFLVEQGVDVIEPDYGYILGIETRALNPAIVGTMLPFVQSGDVLVGHSNGCAIAYELLTRGAPAVGAVFINAALERAIVRPRGVQWIDCYWNPGDDVTIAAQVGRDLGILDSDWGEMGHAGPLSDDPAVVGINCGATPGMPVVSGHSDFFTPAQRPWWQHLYDRLRAHAEAA